MLFCPEGAFVQESLKKRRALAQSRSTIRCLITGVTPVLFRERILVSVLFFKKKTEYRGCQNTDAVPFNENNMKVDTERVVWGGGY